MSPPKIVFDATDAEAAWRACGANCGPGALAAVCNLTPLEAVNYIPRFREKGHTKETMLRSALISLGVDWSERTTGDLPTFGLVRVLWHGPWWNEGLIERFKRSHWIATFQDKNKAWWVFDINAISVGGWISFEEWQTTCAPWLCATVEGSEEGWDYWERFDLNFPAP